MAPKGRPRDMKKWLEVLRDPDVHFPGESDDYRRARNRLLRRSRLTPDGRGDAAAYPRCSTGDVLRLGAGVAQQPGSTLGPRPELRVSRRAASKQCRGTAIAKADDAPHVATRDGHLLRMLDITAAPTDPRRVLAVLAFLRRQDPRAQ